MYRRNSRPAERPLPPGYGGTAFGPRPAWPPPATTPPPEVRQPRYESGYAPFAAGKRPEPPPIEVEAEEHVEEGLQEVENPPCEGETKTEGKHESHTGILGISEDTLLLLGILLLLTDGEEGKDLLPALAILLLL